MLAPESEPVVVWSGLVVLVVWFGLVVLVVWSGLVVLVVWSGGSATAPGLPCPASGPALGSGR